MSKSTIDKMRENLRLQQTYNVFLRYGWDILFARWDSLNDIRLHMQRWVWRIPEDLAEMSTPAKVCTMLEELGPTYVKMGQIVSSQASIVPPEWQEELDKLQSDVSPFPSEIVRETIIGEFGSPPEELYATFEEIPFAAASTAQVHRALLHDGTMVVVKVQRPDIREKMKADMGIMQYAAKVASNRSEELQAVDLVGMLDQFGTSVLAELDYGSEAYNALRLASDMADIEGVHIPTVYPQLSTSRVITMEFIPGVKINNLDAIDAAGLDRAELASNALRAIIKQLLIDGFFHADPHPGNVLVNLETGEITFIDTGMVGELGFHERVNVIQLVLAIQQNDVDAMAQIMRNMSVPFRDDIDEDAYRRDFTRTIGRYMYGTGVCDFGQAVTVALDVLRENGLRLDPDLTMGIKALLQAQAIATALFPQGGLVEEGATLVREMATEQIQPDKVVEIAKKQVTATARDVLNRMPSLQAATISWLEQYQKGRFEISLDTSALSPDIGKISRIGRMAVIALLLVGMIVGSAIATTVMSSQLPLGQAWEFLFQMSYLGYVFAMIVAASLF